MNTADHVKACLAPYRDFAERHGSVAVTTACLYPSNSLVTVSVCGGPNGMVVSDEGRAIDELTALNREIEDADKFLRKFCTKSGLKTERGKIASPIVSHDQLSATVAFVANASAAAVKWGVDHLKSRIKSNIRNELELALKGYFTAGQFKSERHYSGKSTRVYKFEHVIRQKNQLILIDPVLPDASSINSRAVAHFDVQRLGDDNIIQRIIYDDGEEKWNSADLDLLQMSATLVPFSRLGQSIEHIRTIR